MLVLSSMKLQSHWLALAKPNVPFRLYSSDIKLLAKTKTWEETTNSLKNFSEGTCLTNVTQYGTSCESLPSGPTRCQYNQLLTVNPSPSTWKSVKGEDIHFHASSMTLAKQEVIFRCLSNSTWST